MICWARHMIEHAATMKPAGYLAAMESANTSSDSSQVCVTEDDYARLCRQFSPGTQPEPAPLPVVALKITKPGDLLAWTIQRVTKVVPGPNCPCQSRMNQMNEWGWAGCFRHRATILDWIGEEAAKRGHPIGKNQIRDLLRAAWRIQGQ